MKKIFLDAFVKKDDFNAEFNDGTRSQSMKTTISITELESNSFFLNALRKPDFQRETNDWDSDKVVEFLDSLVSNELIPSIILWKNENNLIFLIDGAHRVSAVCAWINDDYGDGEISPSDYVKIKNSILGTEKLEGIYKTAGDVNKDGKVRLYDALQILKQSILGGDLTDEMLYIMDYNDDGKVRLYDALKFLQQAILS